MKDFGRMFGFDKPAMPDAGGQTGDQEIEVGDRQILLRPRLTIWAAAHAHWSVLIRLLK